MESEKDTWRECISVPIIEGLHGKDGKETSKRYRAQGRKGSGKTTNVQLDSGSETNPEELTEFIEYVAYEIFDSFPEDLKSLSYYKIREHVDLDTKYSVPVTRGVLEELASLVPDEVVEAISSCGLVNDNQDLERFLRDPVNSYIEETTRAPSSSLRSAKATECEICERDWIPLTYHHLIPRAVHTKVIKRGWHTEERLNDVAWLCRACHSMVHRIANHEELAREYYTVDLLLEREEVQRFAVWISRVRWKAR